MRTFTRRITLLMTLVALLLGAASCTKKGASGSSCGMRGKSRIRKTEQRRLLHLHDAPIGEVAGSEREVSDLQHESRTGAKERRR